MSYRSCCGNDEFCPVGVLDLHCADETAIIDRNPDFNATGMFLFSRFLGVLGVLRFHSMRRLDRF